MSLDSKIQYLDLYQIKKEKLNVFKEFLKQTKSITSLILMLYKSYKIFIKGIKVGFVVEEKIAIAQTSTFDTENK